MYSHGHSPGYFPVIFGTAGWERTNNILMNNQARDRSATAEKFGPGDKGRRNNPGPAPHPNGRMRLPSGRLQGGELNPLSLPRKGVQCSSFGIRRENFELATRVGKTSDRALTDKLHRRLSMMGVEPISRAWEAVVLPAFARLSFRFAFRSGGQVRV